MEHTYFSNGNQKRISWIIETGDSTVEEMREHVPDYLDKVNDDQSKYIAMHAGIFWGIGRFIIKNEDTVNVMLDSKTMYEHLSKNTSSSDKFIETRSGFIKQLIEQRKLNIHYHLIDSKENLASKLL